MGKKKATPKKGKKKPSKYQEKIKIEGTFEDVLKKMIEKPKK